MEPHADHPLEIRPTRSRSARTTRLDESEFLRTLQAVRDGDFQARLPGDWTGLPGKIADTFNEIVATNGRLAQELERVGHDVGKQGKTGQRVRLGPAGGAWDGMEASINALIDDMLWPMAEVTRAISAVAQGDLQQTIKTDLHARPLEGEFLRAATIVNTMIQQLALVTSEVTRVASEVGIDGKLGGQAQVTGVGGVWRDLTQNVNSMANNLTAQVRNIAEVTIAVADGDLSKKITVDVRGEILLLKEAINTMVDQLRSFASEVTRVAREVGTEGKLGGQAIVPGVAGTWKDLTDNVNLLAANLTTQVRNIAEVTTAVARGDLSKKITVDVKGEVLELKNTINTMVDQLNAFAWEVTRVAREVGTEGKLGGQAQVPGVAGTWKDLTDNVNSMAGNLTAQVRNIAEVATAIAGGDLSRKITVDVRGEILQLKETINTMVDQLNAFASEVTRVAREVGTEGKLGGQAQVPGVAGTWKGLTDNVNSMASNLTDQVRNIAEVTTAVARGDLSRKITVDVKGEILELKNTINTMVDQLNAFAAEVTRVAREVGTEGKLGGQAQVPGVAGTWKDLTDNVNSMAGNLTAQVRNIAEVATAIARGDLSKKITVDVRGEILQLKETLNTMVEQLRSFAAEVTRVAREVGTEGKLGGQAQVPGVAGTWKDLTDNVNLLAANLTTQVRNIAEVTTAVARGDLSKKITVDVRGEILELKDTINTMVDQLNAFAAEVARVAREVGTEGKLGGQAQVPGVAGTWKDLTDNVNVMAANLTEQVRGVVKVVTAVADGVLEQKLTVKSKGEIAALAETINNMIDTLATFADQVTTVAREVGVEGRLGGQANVPGASGTWKDLTGNVNRLAANLTTQVRAIAEVATAVTQGDMTRSIQVEARGEVAELKDNINTMIGNLRLTTEHNREQDWLKTNQARFTGMLQGQRELTKVGNLILSELVPLVGAHQGLIYRMSTGDTAQLRLLASYGRATAHGYPERLQIGEGLIGQCAADQRRILVGNIPSDAVPIDSTLLTALPRSLVVLPVVFEGRIKAVIGLASLGSFTPMHLAFLEQLTSSIGIVLNGIEATMQTESLLAQSQQLAIELQTRQNELQQTNEQLAQKAQQLAEQNAEVERKNQQIEQARRALEEKAAELALTSKYKSEFLANMSHELRTPLNSILVLGQQLAHNGDGNLTTKQVEFARTIHGAGSDLLTLITDILDLSKIESGTVTVEAEDVSFASLLETARRSFLHEAESRNLTFEVHPQPELAHKSIVTDSKRLLQVLKNLLSNAFKFTEHGGVELSVSLARSGWSSDNAPLAAADAVVAFTVSDTGIGIPLEKQRLIFEAFQQADASTSRKYGGTGLGLAISRELASLLGGEIQLSSTPGVGSKFTLYLPLRYAGPVEEARNGSNGTRIREPRSTSVVRIERVPDDRDELVAGDLTLLIVEEDPSEARMLVAAARETGFKVLVAARGSEAQDLARRLLPSAISLDLALPDMPGWNLLSELKRDPITRHIPVQLLSPHEDEPQRAPRGAFDRLTMPADTTDLRASLARLRDYALPRRKRLLVVEGDASRQRGVSELLARAAIDIVAAGNGGEALEALRGESFDCVMLDLDLPDVTGFELLEQIRDDKSLGDPPVVVALQKPLSDEDGERLRELARGVVIREASSPEQLLEETALLMHLAADQLPLEEWRRIEERHDSDEDLAGKVVLIVDDDVRNIFALSSVLEGRGMRTLAASNGADAITKIESTPEVAIVLMDIMMPEMDGFETMRTVRRNPARRGLPILALTAKAMPADREKCLEAGASDYLAKPVDTTQLLAALRMWLKR
jgi:HAMP domain-containing protein/signal transduction histidine kinase/DNA-binding response OmpR family regulator